MCRIFLAFALAIAVQTTLTPGITSAASPPFTPAWITTTIITHLWSGPGPTAVDYGAIAPGSKVVAVRPIEGTRVYIFVPWTKNYAYVDVASVTAQPSTTTVDTWLGRAKTDVLVRTAPSTQAAVLGVLPANTAVQVVAWVPGDQIVYGDWTWAKFIDGTYAYGEALSIVPPTAPPTMPAVHPTGNWIDVNTLHQTVVAYTDNQPIYMAIGSTGSPGWETTIGTHLILRRIDGERMRGSTLNLPPDRQAQATYDIPNVRYTQYFSDDGSALHQNYWLADSEFGIPHSHGCVGLRTADAAWFWAWATIGTPVVVH